MAKAQRQANAAAALAAAASAEASEASEDAADALLATDQIVDGTTEFTALNMAGTDVAPFLAKTDGDKLVEASGLDSGVVETPAIAAEAVTAPGLAFTATNVSIAGTPDVELQSLTVTVEAGERVDLIGSVSVSAIGKNGVLGEFMGFINVRLKRDGTTIYDAACAPVIHAIPIPVLATAAWSDAPSAGSHTYTLCTHLSDAGDTSTASAANRYLSATRVKR